MGEYGGRNGVDPVEEIVDGEERRELQFAVRSSMRDRIVELSDRRRKVVEEDVEGKEA